ncbi:radical SAM protein [Desulfotomaculum sp. 1211_IL3151]|uniref:radical SAM protein n=1 Tax=Desulfotomaculum sp. 1211_IL3151 TaxID=3084055 RepID=UPI002FD98B60
MKKASFLTFYTESGSEYLYDSNNGAVFPINNLIKKAIELYKYKNIEVVQEELSKEFPDDSVNGTLSFIDRWNRNFNGLYMTEEESNNSQKNLFLEKDIQNLICSGMLYQLIINLTEDCSLRCKYCYLSETYKYTRNRTKNKMSFEIGAKAIDYLFNILGPVSRKIPSKRAAITFYGGEPLLSFPTMKKLVNYINEKSPVPIYYNITTNGLHLTDEISDFLVANEFNILVSLDGDKNEHDRNRVLPDDRGSFHIVYKNLRRFQERFPNYSKILLAGVYDYKTDIITNVKFYEKNKLPLIAVLSAVLNINTKYYETITDEDKINFHRQRKILENDYFNIKKKGGLPSNYLRAFVETNLIPIILRQRIHDLPKAFVPYTGTCIPGMKFSVRTDGTFDICERVNSTIPIGNVETGFNYRAINNIIKNYNDKITMNCHKCLIRKICPLCFAQCNKESDFQLPKGWCTMYKEHIMKCFSDVYSVIEVREDAFKELEEVTRSSINNLLFN